MDINLNKFHDFFVHYMLVYLGKKTKTHSLSTPNFVWCLLILCKCLFKIYCHMLGLPLILYTLFHFCIWNVLFVARTNSSILAMKYWVIIYIDLNSLRVFQTQFLFLKAIESRVERKGWCFLTMTHRATAVE